ncbi:DUF4186 family protein [Sporolactobacillus sp. THM7-7]|nr:DUF4186 family protein [Sporolactobacillus sp. THM7-7]
MGPDGCPPIRVKCTDADCAHDLHCFLENKKMIREGKKDGCRYCGVRPVDWARVHQRNFDDVAYTIRSLNQEFIRYHFWHVAIDQRAINHARRKGRVGIREAAEHRLRKSVGSEHPFRDGRQTPFEGNIIYYAQHATATCCRNCIYEWHNVPKGRTLTEEEIRYFTNLVKVYINCRLPDLTETGEYVPHL